MEALKKKIGEILEQEPFRNQGLTLLDIGSDKVVFETQGSSRKVLKVSQSVLRQKVSLLLMTERGVAHSSPVGTDHNIQMDAIEEDRKNEDEAKEILGQEHFLRRGVFRTKIPITKEFLRMFANESQKEEVEKLPDGFNREIEMLAETQLVAEELKDPEKFSTIAFATDLMRGDSFRNASSIDEAFMKARDLIDGNFLVECQELLEDPAYEHAIREVVSKIIAYTKKTGMLIDIFGKNITLFRTEDGSIDFHILEVTMPGPKEGWAKNISEDPHLRLLRHYYVYFYSVRKLGEMLGIENNLELKDLVYFKGHELPTGSWPRTGRYTI